VETDASKSRDGHKLAMCRKPEKKKKKHESEI